jgi:hypothetical protein
MSTTAWVLEHTRCHFGKDEIFCDCCRHLAARIIAGNY